jgi:hypothetical protein
VHVEDPSGADWLQARGKSESEAREAVRKIIMPGVVITDARLVGTSERWAA